MNIYWTKCVIASCEFKIAQFETRIARAKVAIECLTRLHVCEIKLLYAKIAYNESLLEEQEARLGSLRKIIDTADIKDFLERFDTDEGHNETK